MAKRATMADTGSTSSTGTGGSSAGAQPEQAPQRGQVGRLVVDQLGVLPEDVVALGPGGVLELEHRLRIEEVDLALAPPLVLAPRLELAVRPLGGPVEMGQTVPGGHLRRQHVEPHAPDAAHRAGEVLVDHLAGEADGLEDLGAGVGRHGGDAHLGHDLDHALARRLDVVVRAWRGVTPCSRSRGRSCRRWSRRPGRGSPPRPRSPMSRAMWCTSRASPVSTTRPTRVRDFSRIRCSCTAAASSSDGMGPGGVGVAVGQDDDVGPGRWRRSPGADVLDGGSAAPSPPPVGRTGRRWRRRCSPASRRAR